MAQQKKRNKKRSIDASQLKMAKVPVELALEDLMRDLAKKGVRKFGSEEKPAKEDDGTARPGKMFVLHWTLPDGQKQYTALMTANNAEIKSLRVTYRMYVREMNKAIKKGEFKKRPEPVKAEEPKK